MSLQIVIQIGTLLSVVVGFTGLLLAINNNRRQMNAQVMMKYSERFERIMDTFPEEFFLSYYLNGPLPPESNKLTLTTIKYLNLCTEEFYLQKNRYMAKDVWVIWEGDIKQMLKSPLFTREWPKIKGQFEPYNEFFCYVENIINTKTE